MLDQHLKNQLAELTSAGLYKHERVMTSPQYTEVATQTQAGCLNFCANNYLGLANSPVLIDAAKHAMDSHGLGLASVRFICGTQDIHKQLERKLSQFLGREDCILYSSCFDANTGLFETLLDEQDAIISDALNHASIIDGIRLCKAKRYRYANNDMAELEACLKQAERDGVRHKMIVTDGVFSMDGVIANLPAIVALKEKYHATLCVDDSHAVGVLGKYGRGSIEHCQVTGKVDILTGTFGKALGGASGGYIAASQTVVDWLRQRSRPYLFSNSLAPAVVGATIAALDWLSAHPEALTRLHDNTAYFRQAMQLAGFNLGGETHPIAPVMLGDAQLAGQFADLLLAEGIYVMGFYFPVVPQGKARIRVQISAVHSREQLEQAVHAFSKIGRQLGVID